MNKSIPSSRSNRHLQFGRKKILQILEEIESGLSRRDACQKFGMAASTLTEWFAQYGSEQYQSQKRRVFSVQQKRSIVAGVREGRMTKKEACLSHRITQKLLNTWILRCKRDDEELQSINQELMPITTTTANDLPSNLAEARLKIQALETLIEIAEEQFNISIRKKSGAKQ